MKKNLVYLAVFLSLLATGIAYARMVYYHDDEGKIHYVNTDFSRVPEKYLPQVQAQLKAPEPTPSPEFLPDIPPPPPEAVLPEVSPTPEIKPQNLVEVFVAANCPNCVLLESLLKDAKIPYQSYDIQDSETGRQFRMANINVQLPVTRIKGQLVEGLDLLKITEFIKKTYYEKDSMPSGNN